MRAIRHHEFGPATVLQWESLPDPEPGPRQVRVAVEAAGVHLLDTSIRGGMSFPSTPLPELPMVPGREVAGVVDRVGKDVDEAWLGRRVVAHLGPGARGGYAELALVDAGRLYDIPDGLDAPTAVAAIGTGRTAAGILDHAAITSDDVVAVTSAAGGLGALLLRGARNAGARTVGLASGTKLDLVRRLGADTAIDYRRPDWIDVLRATEPRLTLVLDGVGGDVPRALHRLLAPAGRMVRFSGDTEGYDASDRPIIDVLGPVLMARIADYEREALAAAADGSRVPYVGSVFPLAEAAAAHAALEGRATTGKVVLVVDR